MENIVKDSKLLSYYLRHHPEEAGCDIDENGWVDVDTLCENTKFTKEYLKEIVENDTRYAFSDNGRKIKAFHGHSVNVKYTNEAHPDILYHGTSKELYKLILETGYIKSMSRTKLHLSESEEKAKIIGARHGVPVVLKIDCDAMERDGFKFFKSEDGVYLSDDIPIKYILK